MEVPDSSLWKIGTWVGLFTVKNGEGHWLALFPTMHKNPPPPYITSSLSTNPQLSS